MDSAHVHIRRWTNLKVLLVTVLAIFTIVPLSAQIATEQTNNLSKYWAYRQRLKQKFVWVSSNVETPGNNIPASDRLPGDFLSWGDANNMWNHYLTMLATEMWLLKNNEQNYTQSLTELYYAMLAIERLDFLGESVYRHVIYTTEDRNGMYMRDDATAAFWSAHQSYFGVPNIASTATDPSAPPEEISQDNIYHTIEGLALIARILTANESVAGIPTTFDYPYTPLYLESKGIKSGNNINFSLWAKDIITRYIVWFQANVKHTWPLPDIHWILFNPVVDAPVRQGSGEDRETGLWYNAGLIQLGLTILGQDLRTQAPDGISVAMAQGLFQTLFFHGPAPLDIDLPDPIPDFHQDNFNDALIRTLATTSNYLGNQTFDVLRQLRDGPDVFDYEHLPLYWTILHDPNRQLMYPGNAIYENDRALIQFLLNQAPTSGPGSIDGPYNGHPYWGSSSRLVWPENITGKPDQAGYEYSGLDYMVLHNLYYMAFRDEDFKNAVLNNDPVLNTTFSNGDFRFRKLDMSLSLASNANATFNAQAGVRLTSGFIAPAGSTVLIGVQPRGNNYNGTLYKLPGNGRMHVVDDRDSYFDPYYASPVADAATTFELKKEKEPVLANYMVSPNPVKQTMVIQSPSEGVDGSRFELMSIQGQILYKGDLNEDRHLVDVSNLTSGTYIVKFYSDNKVNVQKIMIIN